MGRILFFKKNKKIKRGGRREDRGRGEGGEKGPQQARVGPWSDGRRDGERIWEQYEDSIIGDRDRDRD